MIRPPLTLHVLMIALLVSPTAPALGKVQEFEDKDDWITAAGAFVTIDFTGFPSGTFITDQYAELGVVFTDGVDLINCCNKSTYPEDGAGMAGIGDIDVEFNAPRYWIAVDYPGLMQFELFNSGESIYRSSEFLGGGAGNFAGLVSDVGFDAARIFDPSGDVFIDDLHFGGLPPGDLDGDGTVGVVDFRALLDAWGPCPGPCPPRCPADLDGDCAVGVIDFLLLLDNWGLTTQVPDCNGNGPWDFLDIQDGTSADCNLNSVPDECDVAGGTSPDFNGDGIPDECQPPPNDDCSDAIAVTDGAVAFNSFGATAKGPLALCGDFDTFANDLWYVYTASCTGIATFSLCNDADFDTLLAVYPAGPCPPSLNPGACSDDAPGCGQTSEAQMLVVEGFPYLIRVGGADGGGLGVLTVSCKAP